MLGKVTATLIHESSTPGIASVNAFDIPVHRIRYILAGFCGETVVENPMIAAPERLIGLAYKLRHEDTDR